MEDMQQERSHCKPGRRPSLEAKHAGMLSSDSSVGTMRNEQLLFKSPSQWYFVIRRTCSKSLQSRPIFVTPWTVAHQALCQWDSPGKSTEVGCHFLLQGIFLALGSNPDLHFLHWQAESLLLCHLRSLLMRHSPGL